MFDALTQRLARTVDALRGRGRLTEDNIADTLRQMAQFRAIRRHRREPSNGMDGVGRKTDSAKRRMSA